MSAQDFVVVRRVKVMAKSAHGPPTVPVDVLPGRAKAWGRRRIILAAKLMNIMVKIQINKC